jgi:biopolymer transport protein ExbB
LTVPGRCGERGARTFGEWIVKRVLFFLLAAMLGVLPGIANAWWQNDWSYRKAITIDASPKGANLAESAGRVPLLIRLHSGNFQFDGLADNGADIRFVAADDKTPLNYHVEQYDPVLGVALIWVDVPKMPAGAAESIWMYYGKKAPDGGKPADTFDADYARVPLQRRAGHAAEGRDRVREQRAERDVARDRGRHRRQGRALRRQCIADAAREPVAERAGRRQLHVQRVGQAGRARAEHAAVQPPRRRERVADRPRQRRAVRAGRRRGRQRGAGAHADCGALAANQWAYLAVTADGKNLTVYVNGKQAAQVAAVLPALNGAATVGADAAGAPAGFAAYNGALDELRLSKIARTPAALALDALAQGSESKLVAYGADEKQSGFGFGYFGVIVQSVTVDAWVVITILLGMALVSWVDVDQGATSAPSTRRTSTSCSAFAKWPAVIWWASRTSTRRAPTGAGCTSRRCTASTRPVCTRSTAAWTATAAR